MSTANARFVGTGFFGTLACRTTIRILNNDVHMWANRILFREGDIMLLVRYYILIGKIHDNSNSGRYLYKGNG